MRSKLAIVTGVVLAGLFLCAGAKAQGKKVKKQGEFYEVIIVVDEKEAQIRVEGKNGYHCNTSYPWKLTVGEGDSQQVFKRQQAKTFTEKEVVFGVGAKGSKGQLKMSMCNEKQCKMEKIPLTW